MTADDSDADRTDPEPPPSSELLGRLRSQRGSGAQGTRYEHPTELARGGMGLVLKVWDGALRRTLAMKVVLPPGESGAGASAQTDAVTYGRFLEEAQITGQLEHPGIVPVHELGIDADDRPYFTMRLVRGEDLRAIVERARAERDGWTQLRVLGVLLKVCEALAYAHSKGVIHRDLKPANVMVGSFGEVYVMDWGLARVQGRSDSHDLRLRTPVAHASTLATARREERLQQPDSPLVTMDGDVLGTPSFMSPEQARGELARLGPHSDVYAVGAMLYQLLTGQLPYVPAGARVSPRTVLAAVIAGPPSSVESLAPRTPPELVAITERAMARSIDERYADTQALADDLRAFLEGRVVAAYETGVWAETRKWMTRNKALAAALFATLLATSMGVVAFGVQAERAREAAQLAQRSEREAQSNAARALAVTDFVQRALRSSDPRADGSQSRTVVDAMDTAVLELDAGALSDDPLTEAALRFTIGTILAHHSRFEQALRLGRESLATRQELVPGDHDDVADSLDLVGGTLVRMGRAEEALPVLTAASEMLARLHPGDHERVAESLSNLGVCLSALGRRTEALAAYEQALAVLRRIAPGDHPQTALCLNNVASQLGKLGRDAESASTHEQALAMWRRLHPGDHPDVVLGLGTTSTAYVQVGRAEEALELREAALEMSRRLYAGDHLDTARCLILLATSLRNAGRREEALSLHLEGSAMLRRLLPGDHREVATALNQLGSSLMLTARAEQALPLIEAALAMRRRLTPGDDSEVALSLGNLGECLRRLVRLDAALQVFDESLAMRERLAPDGDKKVVEGLHQRAACLQDLGRHAEAIATQERALELALRVLPEDDRLQDIVERGLERRRAAAELGAPREPDDDG